MIDVVRRVLRDDAAGGLALLAAALVGLLWANSPLQWLYAEILAYRPAAIGLNLSIADWINSGLMAIFFFTITLEIKREVLEGELSTIARAALPAIAALGGILVPATICAAFLWHDPERLRGWAVPVATDIAFALAALSIVGRAVPPALKIFVTALAAIDDVAAIGIIALVYTAHLAANAALAALVCVLVAAVLNRLRVAWLPVYLAIGAVLWFCVLRSGVHATLAGVLLAAMIPSVAVKRLETELQPWVAFVVLPVFGLFNAGVSVRGLQSHTIFGALPLGIVTALFVGKQVGIFGFSQLAIKCRIAALPRRVTWPMMYGVALLGGIGFTMSLFIGSLAFSSPHLLLETKIGVFAGSLLSALVDISFFSALCGERYLPMQDERHKIAQNAG